MSDHESEHPKSTEIYRKTKAVLAGAIALVSLGACGVNGPASAEGPGQGTAASAEAPVVVIPSPQRTTPDAAPSQTNEANPTGTSSATTSPETNTGTNEDSSFAELDKSAQNTLEFMKKPLDVRLAYANKKINEVSIGMANWVKPVSAPYTVLNVNPSPDNTPAEIMNNVQYYTAAGVAGFIGQKENADGGASITNNYNVGDSLLSSLYDLDNPSLLKNFMNTYQKSVQTEGPDAIAHIQMSESTMEIEKATDIKPVEIDGQKCPAKSITIGDVTGVYTYTMVYKEFEQLNNEGKSGQWIIGDLSAAE